MTNTQFVKQIMDDNIFNQMIVIIAIQNYCKQILENPDSIPENGFFSKDTFLAQCQEIQDQFKQQYKS